MNNGQRRKSGFGAFLKVIIVLALLSAVGFIGFKTYQKLSVITFVSNLAQAVTSLNMEKLSDSFTPGSNVKKAADIANKIESMPVLGDLAGGLAGLIGSKFDFQVDYSDIRITVNENAGQAVIGIINKKQNDQKRYLTLKLTKIDTRWYAAELPSVQSASEVGLSYKNSLQGYAERASDYAALLIYSLNNK